MSEDKVKKLIDSITNLDPKDVAVLLQIIDGKVSGPAELSSIKDQISLLSFGECSSLVDKLIDNTKQKYNIDITEAVKASSGGKVVEEEEADNTVLYNVWIMGVVTALKTKAIIGLKEFGMTLASAKTSVDGLTLVETIDTKPTGGKPFNLGSEVRKGSDEEKTIFEKLKKIGLLPEIKKVGTN